MAEADDEREFREELIGESRRVRIPSLPLRVFSMYVSDDDGDENVADDEYHDYLPADIPADERNAAHARRGAIMMAANQVVERCIADLQDVEFDDDGLPRQFDHTDLQRRTTLLIPRLGRKYSTLSSHIEF